MAPSFSQHFLCLFLLFVVPPTPCLSQNNNAKLSQFEFLKNLEGSKMGDSMKELHHLREYLNRFGYLENLEKNDVFDDQLQSAIMTFQLNHNLNITGVLDSQTMTKMLTPRCGVPDIINGTNKMYHRGLSPFEMVSHYKLFENNPKWTKTLLTVGFRPDFPTEFIPAIRRAFDIWARVTNFTFYLIPDEQDADIQIAFASGEHGDYHPFDGPGGVMAHASPPETGMFHLDASQPWSIGAVPHRVDVVSVAVHEIGHVLGLAHSNVEAAVMYPYLALGVDKTTLNKDDILGIRALYGL